MDVKIVFLVVKYVIVQNLVINAYLQNKLCNVNGVNFIMNLIKDVLAVMFNIVKHVEEKIIALNVLQDIL